MTADVPLTTEETPVISPEPTVRPTAYEVSCLPEDHVDAMHFTITVEYRGRELWAVRRGPRCLSADGTWNYERMPSSRDDEWLSTHRFELDTALRLARNAAPHMTVNGYTIADVLAREAS